MDYLLKDEKQTQSEEKIIPFIKKNWRKIYIILYIIGSVATTFGILFLSIGLNLNVTKENNSLFETYNQMATSTKNIIIGIGLILILFGIVSLTIATILLIKDKRIKKYQI